MRNYMPIATTTPPAARTGTIGLQSRDIFDVTGIAASLMAVALAGQTRVRLATTAARPTVSACSLRASPAARRARSLANAQDYR